MSGLRKEFSGGVQRTTLVSGITSSALSMTLDTPGSYPLGAAPFVLVIDRDTAAEEKVLVATRSGQVCIIQTRGYDGTTAVAHDAGATVEHVLDAITVDEANRIASLLTTRGDLIGHSSTAGAAGLTRVPVGTNGLVLTANSAAAAGVAWAQINATGIANGTITQTQMAADSIGQAQMRDDSVGTDEIIDNSITNAHLQDNIVSAAELQADAVTNAKILNNTILPAKLNAAVAGAGLVHNNTTGLAVNVDDATVFVDSDVLKIKNGGVTLAKLDSDFEVIRRCTVSTRPAHAEGRLIYETDTNRVRISTGSTWHTVHGRIGAVGVRTSGQSVGAGATQDATFPTVTKEMGDSLGTAGNGSVTYSGGTFTTNEPGIYSVTVEITGGQSSSGSGTLYTLECAGRELKVLGIGSNFITGIFEFFEASTAKLVIVNGSSSTINFTGRLRIEKVAK